MKHCSPEVVVLLLLLTVDPLRGFLSPSARIWVDRSKSHAFRLVETTLLDTKPSATKFDSFSYEKQWYPVSWACDLRVGQPNQVTLFDVNYALVLESDNKVTAFLDTCPHRKAALSEGRVTESGYLQCAYHGWSFAANGTCVQIPQAASTSYSPRTCATTVPAIVHQSMVWIWPGATPAEGTPPTIPEMDDPAFRISRAVRDFPMVDWSILMSNILDPDHGLFAHQQPGFDLYSASPEEPISVEQDFAHAGWTLTTRVPAVEKLRAKDRMQRSETVKNVGSTTVMTGMTIFHAPGVATIGRRQDDGTTKFLAAFWVCPTGVGRSRFMSASVAKIPFTIPRWVTHLQLNSFLDQDTVLVASQQPHVLTREAQRYLGEIEESNVGRSNLFVYQSPTDKSVRLIDQFWDATLQRSPNRVTNLLALYRSGALKGIPDRSVVLDRKRQHLDICKDSQDVVRNCRAAEMMSLLTLIAWTALRLGKKTLLSSIRWPILSTLVFLVARKVCGEFYYAHTTKQRDKDLRKIPSKWMDPR